MSTSITNDITFREITRELNISIAEAIMLLTELITASKGRGKSVSRAMECIRLGSEALKNKEKSVRFIDCVHASLEERIHLRTRTQSDIRYIANRFIKYCPGLSNRQIRSISPEDCRKYIDQTFSTPRQRQKGRLILSGIFSTGIRKGWCSSNPISQVRSPLIKETRIRTLTTGESKILLQTAARLFNGECLPAIAIMLYAGIRPHEIQRLTWQEVDLQNNAIYIPPQHSKTGGARQVTIQPVLKKLLKPKDNAQPNNHKICPRNWSLKWKRIRQNAGWGTEQPWIQDILRHTFASYYSAYYKNWNTLQLEMGHSDTHLLRTRYLNLDGITHTQAKRFWKGV